MTGKLIFVNLSSGWGWDQGPPPPPGNGRPPPPGFKSFTRPSDAPPTYEESFQNTFGTQSQSSGPGFFSGLGLGGLAGYMYGRSQNRFVSFQKKSGKKNEAHLIV